MDPTNIEAENHQMMMLASGRSSWTVFYGAARWYLKSSGMYQLPRGFSLGYFFQVREGYMNPPFVKSDNRPNRIGFTRKWLEPVGETTLPVYWNLDLRGEKTFDFPGDVRLHVIGDLFNASNNDIVLSTFNRLNASTAGTITEVMQGFTFRLGFRLVLR
jgi:hypothetical protein